MKKANNWAAKPSRDSRLVLALSNVSQSEYSSHNLG